MRGKLLERPLLHGTYVKTNKNSLHQKFPVVFFVVLGRRSIKKGLQQEFGGFFPPMSRFFLQKIVATEGASLSRGPTSGVSYASTSGWIVNNKATNMLPC